MATDILARGLAAQTRDSAMPALARFEDLSRRTIPSVLNRIQAGTGAAWAHYVADALATAQLAAAHPLCCAADAAGRYFRLEGVDGTIDFAHTGLVQTGGNMQPAVQAAVAYAAAVGIANVVNGGGHADIEMWCPVRTSPLGLATDGIPLVVQGFTRLRLDFGAAKIILKGPTGSDDRSVGQHVTDPDGKVWRGGWLYIIGSDTCEYFALENVKVQGDLPAEAPRDPSSYVWADQGIRVQDTHVGQIVLRHVEIADLFAELCYLGAQRASDGTSVDYFVEDCHFHGSPQSTFNPNGNGRLVARNIQAGDTYESCESLGGEGQFYTDCRFYDASHCSFQGGPDPAIPAGYNYTYAIRRSDSAPPFVNFSNVMFENHSGPGLILTGWARGRILALDTPVITSGTAVSGIALEIESWVDRRTIEYGFGLGGGPQNLTTQATDAPAGVYIKPPSNIRVSITCKRTALAVANGHSHGTAAAIYTGLYDKDTIQITVAGAAARAWYAGYGGTLPAAFQCPLMVTDKAFVKYNGFTDNDTTDADRTYHCTQAGVAIALSSDATRNITMDTSYGYVVGQRFVVTNVSGSGNRITSFARNGDGLMLNADRTQRRYGEFLELEWMGSRWRELNYLDQGA